MKATTFVLCISLFWIEAAQIKSRKLGGRIIGGEEANAGQFPFAAAIYKALPMEDFSVVVPLHSPNGS
ncbi:hypothetical protein MTP99_009585 [Tenebrio molitor]|nr:hypothetical protein MTP99_009585 [Tenebrio molitor]